MSRVQASLLTVLLLAAALPLVPPASAAPTSHAVIVITSDAGFTFSNGVRSGTGSPADPYVISDWTIDATSGAAIKITGTTKHVVVRDVLVTAPTGATAIDLRDNTDTIELRSLTVDHRGFGVSATNGRVVVDAVVVRDLGSPTFSGAGITARGGFLYVGNSTFISNDQMLRLLDEEALVVNALGVSGFDGVVVNGGDVTVEASEIQVRGYAVQADGAADVTVSDTLLTRPERGVFARNSVVRLDDVQVDAPTGYAAWLEDSRTFATAFSVAGGAQGAFVLHGRADFSASDADSVAGTGIRFLDSTGSVDISTFTRNGGGVAVDGGSLVALTANLFYSNKWGVGIDYAARASIPLLAGNVVNGIPLAGVYHWADANVVYSGTLDSGHSAGFSGSMSREGLLVLYDVQEAFVTGATLSHGTRGVYAVNSFNVVIDGSLILSNLCGVIFNGTVGFVKNSTIDIPVDPPTTCGVTVSGGYAGVINNTIRRVDVGVIVQAGAKVNVSGNLVTNTYLGIVLDGGSPDNVTIEGNVVVGNSIGIDVRARFRGDVVNNSIRANAQAGVRISGGAALDFRANVVVHNGIGIQDVTACASANVVSHFSDNVVANNSGFGASVNGTVIARNNSFSDNGDDGLRVCGSLDGRFDVYARNGEDGLEIEGSADLAVETAIDNEFGAGIRLRGSLFVMIFMNVTGNFDGIIGTEVILPTLPPVPPVTVPPIGPPTVPTIPNPGCLVNCRPPDPIWIHLSTIAANTRFAISASTHTDVNATNNHWGSAQAPRHSIPQVGEFGNRISANVRFVPWFRDADMTDSAPV